MASTVKIWRVFMIWGCIICAIMWANHLIRFIRPIMGLGDTLSGNSNDSGSDITNLPEDPDDLTPGEFAQLASSFQNYNWSEYNPDDFPDWLYMNSSHSGNETVSPYSGYDWQNYHPTDFPSWLDMPATLPVDFDPENFDVFEYMNSDYQQQVMLAMASEQSGNSGSSNDFELLQMLFGESSGDSSSFDISAIFSLLAGTDILKSILWLLAMIIMFIILRTTQA
jgi:hypothetical protein